MFKKAQQIVEEYKDSTKLFLYLEYADRISVKTVSENMSKEQVLRQLKKSKAYNYDKIAKINASVDKEDNYYEPICKEAKKDFTDARHSREEIVELYDSCYGYVDTEYDNNILSFFRTNKNGYNEFKLVCGYDVTFVHLTESKVKRLKNSLIRR